MQRILYMLIFSLALYTNATYADAKAQLQAPVSQGFAAINLRGDLDSSVTTILAKRTNLNKSLPKPIWCFCRMKRYPNAGSTQTQPN